MPSHRITVRDRRTQRVSTLTIFASTRKRAIAWVDQNPNTTIVARFEPRRTQPSAPNPPAATVDTEAASL